MNLEIATLARSGDEKKVRDAKVQGDEMTKLAGATSICFELELEVSSQFILGTPKSCKY